jgi:thymidylate kinase
VLYYQSEKKDMENQVTIATVEKLCKLLNDRGINYCHWKSNAAIDRSESAENDLDILVSRNDVQLFEGILCRLGFKEALPTDKKQIPGILHYYGYDVDADKFVHVHAHYNLIIGHDSTKNYHIPMEKPFLESVVREGLFKICAPEFEFIIFVIRMVFKFSVLDALRGNRVTLTAGVQQELEYLHDKIDRGKMHDILGRLLPYIDRNLFETCIHSLEVDSSIWMCIKAQKRLQKKLAAHARRSQVSDIFFKSWRRIACSISDRIFKRESRKRLKNGGAIIALVGGDGSGKSTAIEGLYEWLSKNFDTIKVHMGRPPCSIEKTVIEGILRRLGKVEQFLKKNRLYQYSIDGNSIVSKYGSLLAYICMARDRYKVYIKARRFASNGGLVISDRFPLPQVNLMDGPKSDKMASLQKSSRLIKLLARTEKKYYQRMMLPEVLIVLRVTPEIATQRKTNEETFYVQSRSQEIWDLDWEHTYAHVIDAGRSKAEVLSEIKFLIWSKI